VPGVITEEKWWSAFETELQEILPEQREVYKSFFEGKNVLFILHTSFQKIVDYLSQRCLQLTFENFL